MRKILNIYTRIEERILVASLVFTVILIFFQIIMRYVFNNSLSWSEELARYIFIWQVWLGAGVGIRMKGQIRIEILLKKLGPKGSKWLNVLALSILLLFCIFLVFSGGGLVMKLISRQAVSSALLIPLSAVFLSLPFSSLVSCLFLIDQLAEILMPEKFEKGGNA
jgi:TRAP-type C4-dicarboxylate transport system permease small subunit